MRRDERCRWPRSCGTTPVRASDHLITAMTVPARATCRKRCKGVANEPKDSGIKAKIRERLQKACSFGAFLGGIRRHAFGARRLHPRRQLPSFCGCELDRRQMYLAGLWNVRIPVASVSAVEGNLRVP